MHVQLRDLVAFPIAGISNLNPNRSCATGVHQGRFYAQIIKAEGRVAEPVTEGK